MAAKKKQAKADENSIPVLVATQLIRGGSAKERTELRAGEELTADRAKALGLDDEAIDQLRGRGVLIERQARVAGGDAHLDPALLKAETDRADRAEAALKTAEEKVADLETKLAQASAAQ